MAAPNAAQMAWCLRQSFRRVKRHVDDQDDFLAEVVKGDNLVKQHQVHILKVLRVLDLHPHGGFAATRVVVGKIADRTACKRGR